LRGKVIWYVAGGKGSENKQGKGKKGDQDGGFEKEKGIKVARRMNIKGFSGYGTRAGASTRGCSDTIGKEGEKGGKDREGTRVGTKRGRRVRDPDLPNRICQKSSWDGYDAKLYKVRKGRYEVDFWCTRGCSSQKRKRNPKMWLEEVRGGGE